MYVYLYIYVRGTFRYNAIKGLTHLAQHASIPVNNPLTFLHTNPLEQRSDEPSTGCKEKRLR